MLLILVKGRKVAKIPIKKTFCLEINEIGYEILIISVHLKHAWIN